MPGILGDPRKGLQLRDSLLTATRNPDRFKQIAFMVAYDDSPKEIAMSMNNIGVAIARAEVYYSVPDVTTLLLHGARSLKAEHLVRFEREDFPAPCGLMYFDGQVKMPSWGAGDEQWLQAILWAAAPEGLMAWSIVTDNTDKDRPIYTFGNCHFRHQLAAPWGRRIEIVDEDRPSPDQPRLDKLKEIIHNRLGDDFPLDTPNDRLADFLEQNPELGIKVERNPPDDRPVQMRAKTFREETIKRFGGLYQPEDSEEDENLWANQALNLCYRMMYAWTQFIDDELVRPEPVPLSRAERRRAERAQEPLPKLNIVLLRRIHHEPKLVGEPREVAWDHRWMVSGHWRNQPYGPRDNPEYRAKYIHPYVKGPEDKPLVVHERVTVLGR